MSYKQNDTVMYGTQGVCEISEIAVKEMNGTSVEYYVLKPIYDEKSTIFIPVDNIKAKSKMRHVLSNEGAYQLLDSLEDEETIWIDIENLRRIKYKEIVFAGDRTELCKLIKTLYQRKQSQISEGKKLHHIDERFLRDAEKILFDEFAYVLEISEEDVAALFSEKILGKKEVV